MALTDVELNIGSGGAKIAVDTIAGDSYEVVKQAFGGEGIATMVDANNPLPVTEGKSSTSAVTSVSDSDVSQVLLAANTGRTGATVFNDSPETLYLKLGDAATTSSFTAKLFQDGYYEVPFHFTGIVAGIWANNAGGQALITELTT